ncbi:MAG TPA: aromatic amino acid transport family protein [Chlamydiales bacterium]|nr:aromatic amino acid transport family protein [Chlamydiales bacterium]
MKIFHSCGHVLGGSLLIAGTSIGVGMLAMPIVTGQGGFIPAFVIYILCWLFMLSTGLLLLEVALQLPKDINFITMTQRMLGNWGKDTTWVVYLFLFITVMIAHVAGGGAVLNELLGARLPEWAAVIIYVVLFSPVVYLGTHSVDRLNLILMAGVFSTYLFFIISSTKEINLNLLTYKNWGKAWFALPVLFTSFTYQVIIPTLVTYMKRDVRKLRLALILGTSIPLLVYLIWEFFILGIIPVEGPNGLIEAQKLGHNAVMPLVHFVQTLISSGSPKSLPSSPSPPPTSPSPSLSSTSYPTASSSKKPISTNSTSASSYSSPQPSSP